MENLIDNNINNIKNEQVCRTCLTDDGNFFNLRDIFDTSTLAQMIQNITNLQMNPLDGYTQSICFECVKEVRRAHKFRLKCLESNEALLKVEIKTLEVPISVYKTELPRVEDIKQEMDVSCDVRDYYLETENDCKSESTDVESDCEDNRDTSIKKKLQDNQNTENENKNNPTIIFDCPLCHGLFSSNTIYKKHINEFHLDRLQDKCFKQKREPLGYILMKKYLQKNKRVFKCVLDEFLGSTFVEFRNHMKEHTGEKPVVCVDCGFRTTEIHLLKAHRLQKHVDEKRFSCPLCDYTCPMKSSLKTHFTIHTGEKNYKCKLCPLLFKTAPALSVHKKRIHENKKPHQCSICQKAFFRSTRLRDHMRIHTGERPHICHYCGRAFSRVENMKTHINLRHEHVKTSFKCDICDYTTRHKPELKLHVMRHNGEKPFKCPQCPFSSLKLHTLKLHILRHSGQRNFACDLCDYKGVSPDCVKRHRIIHTGEKPYPCTICDYSGRSRQALKNHLQTHSTEQNFHCPNCSYKTNVRSILLKHIRQNCVIKKRGRRPSKLPNTPDNILINYEIKEDTEESIDTLSSNI